MGVTKRICDPMGQLAVHNEGRDMGLAVWAQAEGSGPKISQAESANQSPHEELAASAARPTAHQNKKEKELENRMVEIGGLLCFPNCNKVWKRVSRLGEDENPSGDIIPILMGKRKAEAGGSNFDDQ